MAGDDWPKRFFFSPEQKTLLHYVMAFLSIFAAIELALYWETGKLLYLLSALAVVTFGTWGCFTSWRWQQGPVVEAWPDRIRLPRRFWPAHTEVRYDEITHLKRNTHFGLTVVYINDGKTSSSLVPSQYLDGFEQLEQFLQARTGLQVDTARPWLLRLIPDELYTAPLDKADTWKTFAHAGLLGAMVGVVLQTLCLLLFDYDIPMWLLVILFAVSGFGAEVWLFRRRGAARSSENRIDR